MALSKLKRQLQAKIAARSLRKARVIPDRTNPLEIFNDKELIEHFRFPARDILKLTDLLKEQLDHPTQRNKAFPPVIQICIALKFFASGTFQVNVGAIAFLAAKSSVCRTIHRVTSAICRHKRNIIKFPTGVHLARAVQGYFEIGKFSQVIGSIDCTHVKIPAPPGDGGSFYSGNKQAFTVNVQAICGPDRTFYDVLARWPGSVHDSRIFRLSDIPERFETGDLRGYVLLGDSGYPLKPYLLTRYLTPKNRVEGRYNKRHSKMRARIECAFGILKRRFPCLAQLLRVRLNRVPRVIMACACLHNLAIKWNSPEPEDTPDYPETIGDPHLEQSATDDGKENVDPVLLQQDDAGIVFRNTVARDTYEL